MVNDMLEKKQGSVNHSPVSDTHSTFFESYVIDLIVNIKRVSNGYLRVSNVTYPFSNA